MLRVECEWETMKEWERESRWTWFATRLWHRWQRCWLFSLYAKCCRIAHCFSSFCSHEHFFFFSDSWLPFSCHYSSYVLFASFIVLRLFSWWFHTRWKYKQSVETKRRRNLFSKCAFGVCLCVCCLFFCFFLFVCMEFTWDLAPSPLFREKLALQWFFNRNSHLICHWGLFAFIFSDKPKYFRYLDEICINKFLLISDGIKSFLIGLLEIYTNAYWAEIRKSMSTTTWNKQQTKKKKQMATCQRFNIQVIEQLETAAWAHNLS